MTENLSTQLSKTFYPIDERVGASMRVVSGHQSRHKQKHIAFTISLTKPTSIQVYLIKVTEKNEIKKVLLCNVKNIKKIDCRDTKTQPSYELQIITENKTWVFNASKLEEKRQFISLFCRIFATLLPHIFKDVELVNFPQNINISPIGQNESLDVLLMCKTDPDVEASSATGGGGTAGGGDGNGGGGERPSDANKVGEVGSPLSDGYRSLTKREEDDIRQFLDELDNESTLFNAAQLTERLQQQLAHIEGTNVHSIMASESQVLSLMTTLDSAIERAELLEKQLNNYYHFLEEVEDAMATLRDHDQLIQTTVDNRVNLLKVLEELIDSLNVDPRYLRVLIEGDLNTQEGITLCIEAAAYLDRIMNSGFKPGQEHLQAVEERMGELRNLRDAFAVKLSGYVNDTMLRFASQLGFIVNTGVSLPSLNNDSSSSLGVSGSPGNGSTTTTTAGGGGGGGGTLEKNKKHSLIISNSFHVASEVYATQRTGLLQLAPLIGNWLQMNRKDLYIEIKRMYVKKSQSFFRRQIQEVLKFTEDSIRALVRPSKAKDSQRLDNIPSDVGSVMSLQVSDSNFLSQVENIFDNCFDKILTVIRTEQAFVNQFFGFNLHPPSDKSHDHQKHRIL
ncbi:unnamed protein product [Trichobilharzia szidati]|nr:unnamed protein product [Trichobilharzia szidati]